MKENIDHPDHYGGKDNVYEVIKIIEFFKLGFCLGNVVKYILRAGRKDPAKELEDLKKARWYLDREIKSREVVNGSASGITITNMNTNGKGIMWEVTIPK